MSDKTKIEWADASWNPLSGCSKVSDGCTNCYAESMARRFDKGWKPWTVANAERNVMLCPWRLDQPLHWRKPRRVFVCSMSDLFHERVSDDYIARVFAVMACAYWHTFQVLTKRPERMKEFISLAADFVRSAAEARGMTVRAQMQWMTADLWEWPLPNVWLGVSVENQRTADERIPYLLETPAAKRFVSAEPMLEPVNLGRIEIISMAAPINSLDWVIVGGESGSGARPMHPDWLRSIRDQCQAAGVAFFFKGWGKWMPEENLGLELEHGNHVGEDVFGCDSGYMVSARSKWKPENAGRELDGCTWEEFP